MIKRLNFRTPLRNLFQWLEDRREPRRGYLSRKELDERWPRHLRKDQVEKKLKNLKEGEFYGLAVSKEERQIIEDRNQIKQALMEDLKKEVLSLEKAQAGGTRFSIMLWEIRFLLRSLGKTNPRAKTLGDELETCMEKEKS